MKLLNFSLKVLWNYFVPYIINSYSVIILTVVRNAYHFYVYIFLNNTIRNSLRFMKCMLGIAPSISSLLPGPHTCPYPFNFLFFFFLSPLSSICATQVLLVVLLALECDLHAIDNILKDNWLSPHKQLSMTKNCSPRDGSLCLTSLLHTGIILLVRLYMFSGYCKYHSEFPLQLTALMVSGKHCFMVIIYSFWLLSFHPSSTIIPTHQVGIPSQEARFASN